MSKLTLKVKEALAGSQTAAQLKALLLQVNARGIEVRQRQAGIGENGQARRAATESGEFEAVQKLDTEVRDLVIEHEVLTTLERQLRAAFDKTQASEYIAGMPEAYSELLDCLEAEAEAKRALQAAMQATEQRISAITQARVHLNRCYTAHGLTAKTPVAKPELLYKFLDVRGISPTHREGWGRAGHFVEKVADCLGLESPRPSKAA